MKLRALVVDDSSLFRSVVTDALRSLSDVEVVGSAASGQAALARMRELNPDLVTLDIEMPGMNGLQVLDEMRVAGIDAGVIVVSALTVAGGTCTIQALQKGAFDFITKPSLAGVELNKAAVAAALGPRVRALARSREIRQLLRGTRQTTAATAATPPAATARNNETLSAISDRMSRLRGLQRPEMVLIGVSTGGPAALTQLLPSLPEAIGVPILIVQHMPPLFTRALAESLNERSAIRVCEAANGDVLEPGVAYIAPGGRQMKLAAPGADGRKTIAITADPPENNCAPSVDYLFRSAAATYPGRSLPVILTGMGSDGTLGLRLLKRHDCTVIAQDEASCVVYGMPRSAVEAGVVDETLPLDRIAGRVVELLRRTLP